MSDDEMNGNNPNNPQARAQAAAEANIPTLTIKDTIAHGADEHGAECAIMIGSISGQQVRLHFPSLEALADFAVAVKGVGNQMRQNAKAAGTDLVTATPATTFNVGHVAGLPGTLLVLDPGTPNESTFMLDNQMAIDAGKMLVIEAGKRKRIQDAIGGASKLTPAPKRRIIRPGEH